MTAVEGEGALFRDPRFTLAIRQKVCPILRTYPFISVWLPLSGGGEEAYATAIVLREEGLYSRARIYATDADEGAVSRARDGRFALDGFLGAAGDYRSGGGTASLTEYYVQDGGSAVIRPLLRDVITFAQHDLGTDASFNEFQLIVCRDAVKRLAAAVWRRAQGLFHESLCRFGILGLGREDSLSSHPRGDSYEVLAPGEPLFRKVR